MPALVLTLLGFAVGALLGHLAPPAHGGAGVGPGRPRVAGLGDEGTTVVTLLAVLVHGPVCAYFLAFAGDWSVAYLVDARAVPSALVLLVVVADAALVVIGYRLARTRSDSLSVLTWLVGAPLLAALASVVITFPRLRVDATYDEYRLGFGERALAGSPLGWAVVWMGFMFALGALVAHRALRGRAGIRAFLAPQPSPVPRADDASADDGRRLGRRTAPARDLARRGRPE